MDKSGAVKEVNDRSGHYKPGSEQSVQGLTGLENKGVDLNNVKFSTFGGPRTDPNSPNRVTGMANEMLQGASQEPWRGATQQDQGNGAINTPEKWQPPSQKELNKKAQDQFTKRHAAVAELKDVVAEAGKSTDKPTVGDILRAAKAKTSTKQTEQQQQSVDKPSGFKV